MLPTALAAEALATAALVRAADIEPAVAAAWTELLHSIIDSTHLLQVRAQSNMTR